MYSKVAKIAISKAAYHIDRPYDYYIPDDLAGRVLPGMRVLVEFSHYRAPVEGLVLALASSSRFEKLKPVIRSLDTNPILTGKQLKLALFMREHFFCTIYDFINFGYIANNIFNIIFNYFYFFNFFFQIFHNFFFYLSIIII